MMNVGSILCNFVHTNNDDDDNDDGASAALPAAD